jgi:hypothetical protein
VEEKVEGGFCTPGKEYILGFGLKKLKQTGRLEGVAVHGIWD